MFNQVTLAGRTGGDIEVRTTSGGKRIGNFSIATEERSGGKTYTEWHRVAVYNEGLIKLMETHVGKGSQILITGQIRNNDWEKDGVKHRGYEIAMSGNAELKFIDLKKPANAPATEAEPGSEG